MNTVRSRVLVVGLKGNRQGTEKAVDNFVRAVGNRIGFDFLLHEDPAFDACRLPGNRIFTIPRKSKDPFGYRRGLKALFEGHADEWMAVWLNTGNLANIDALKLAERYGCPRRILHAHSDAWLGGKRQLAMTEMNRKRALKLATDRWACSEGAGRLFFGDEPFVFVPNAISYARYAFSAEGRKRVRDEFGLQDRFVIGSVGALTPRKNHIWMVNLLPEIIDRVSDACILLVGEGDEGARLLEAAKTIGVSDRVILAGGQEEIPSLLSAMDVFVLPSLFEGLSLAILEAQANGLPVISSDACTRACAITDSIRFVGLRDGDGWVDAVCSSSRAEVHLNERADMFDLSRQGDWLTSLFVPKEKMEC